MTQNIFPGIRGDGSQDGEGACREAGDAREVARPTRGHSSGVSNDAAVKREYERLLPQITAA